MKVLHTKFQYQYSNKSSDAKNFKRIRCTDGMWVADDAHQTST